MNDIKIEVKDDTEAKRIALDMIAYMLSTPMLDRNHKMFSNYDYESAYKIKEAMREIRLELTKRSREMKGEQWNTTD